jgi:VIT1/CCC1 family predicted Fe2+/Mn2+ transporter
VIGVASAQAAPGDVLVAGVASLVAGAMSMAAGEYVSVRSQADTEEADLARERKELASDVEHEHAELASIYVRRGLDPELAAEVARQLMAHDALGRRARPVQAALASAATFAAGAALPLLTALAAPATRLVSVVAGASLVSLALLGLLAARAGGAPALRAATRVTFWGALAMASTAAVGSLFGTVA